MKHLAPLLWTALAAPLAAQTFIVDAAGGPGANFTTVADAIARVPDGAVLLVRPGTYNQFAVAGKSLTILFDSGAIVSVQISATPPVTIRNIAAQRQVTIRGLQVYNILGGVSFAIEDCAGTVLLEACRSDNSVGVGGFLQIVRSADVRVHRCQFAPSTSVTCASTQSHVRISNSSFDGRIWSTQWTDSIVEIADTAISGFGGLIGIAPVDLSNSSLRVLGGCTLTVNTGILVGGTGTVRIDPSATLSNGGSQQRFGPALQVTTRTMPTLRATTDGAGGTATASLRGPTGGIGALLVGLPTRPTTLPSLEDPILLDPSAALQATAGSFATGVTASYPVPPSPSLQGVRITWQGASLDPVLGAQVSNAVTYVHR